MQIKVVCNYSEVISGVTLLDKNVKTGLKQFFKLMTSTGVGYVLLSLKESYVNPNSYSAPNIAPTKIRFPWTRTGNLQRAIVASSDYGRKTEAGWIAGVGETSQLNKEADYWKEIEEGTRKYIGKKRTGAFVSAQGKYYGPTPWGWGLDKWVDNAGQFIMSPKKPIKAHRYFEEGALRIKKDFDSYLIAIMSQVLT